MYTTAGLRVALLPDEEPAGSNNWPCASTPSLARNDTSFGVTRRAAGKSAASRLAAIPRALPPATGTTAGAGGRWASDPINAIVWLSAVTTGLHSTPVPLVSATGAAAFSGTL